MARINIHTHDEFDGRRLVGWFDPASATRYDADREFNGSNMVSVITRSEWVDEFLYRTAGGRWVLNHDATRYHSGPDTYEFVSDEQAREWLIRSEGNDDAVKEFFGDIEEERGPGRPEIGKPVPIRFGDDLLARIDAEADRRGKSRADTVRELVEKGFSVAA